jgi:hypothetical protein
MVTAYTTLFIMETQWILSTHCILVFDIEILWILSTKCIEVFRVIPIDSDYFPEQH